MGQVNMRDTRVEEVEHISDSDSDEVSQNVEKAMPEPTIGIFPNHVHQGPTYLIFPNRAEQEKWLYQLTVVSGVYKDIILFPEFHFKLNTVCKLATTSFRYCCISPRKARI